VSAAASGPGAVVRVRAVVAGRVHNLRDGRVEIEAQGSRTAVDALVAWAHEGPRLAIVESVTVDALPVEARDSPAARRFAVR
jgi:acylphosphatase